MAECLLVKYRCNMSAAFGVGDVQDWRNRSDWLVFCLASDVYVCGVGLWRVDKQPRPDL